MKHNRLSALLLCLLNAGFAFGEQNARAVKPIESFIAEPSRVTNSATFQGAQLVRKSLNGETFSIPKSWRLVSVVSDTHGSPQSREYVLFFQDTKGAVHTLGLQMSGSISGSNLITIPAQD